MPPETARPAKLTFPSYDVGAASILADGVRVGYILGEFYCWRAHLYAVAGERDSAYGGEQVTGKRLRDLRAELRRRVAEDGPWWAEAHPDGKEQQ